MSSLMGKFMVLALGACCLVGCDDSKTEAKREAAPSLYGTEWELEMESLPGVDKNWNKPEKDITLVIAEDGSVSGNGGVNRYFSGENTVTVDESAGTIKFAPMATTMMAGPGMDYETLYLQTIADVDGFKIVNDELTLMKNGMPVAVFDAENVD